VQRLDPFTFALVPVALVLVAVAATWLPARRAAATSPLTALRNS
jgi:ABC-type lipoprotein release transport system permease subunit